MNPARPVQVAMRTFVAALALLVLALSYGCSSGNKAKTEPKREPTEAERIAQLQKDIEKRTESVDDDVYTIAEPGTKGWKASVQEIGALGSVIDQKMVNAQNLKLQATLTFDDPKSGKMVYQPEIRIKDSKTFDVRFALPQDKGSHTWVRADGRSRAINSDDVWKPLPAFGSSLKPMSVREVREFPRRFPELMFATLTDSRSVWESLFDSWGRGVGGYSATIEEQSYKIGGKMRRVFRIVAKTEQDGGAEVEVTIDAEALRPVAVRSAGTHDDGTKYKMMWSGAWMVGGQLDPGSFKLPSGTSNVPVTT